MQNAFFEKPILNSPYKAPTQYWELDDSGQPTQAVLQGRRPAQYIVPIPKTKRQSGATQKTMVFDEGKGISREGDEYDPTPIINRLRLHIENWRIIPSSGAWGVTPETARLLQHWRCHEFSSVRPFFCQIEAVETLI
jgi:type III restriction enzyme